MVERLENLEKDAALQKELAKAFAQINHKLMLTPGPGNIALENALLAQPLFGRGDDEYLRLEERVLSWLKKMSGHDSIARLIGSAALGLEIVTRNFVAGKILIVDTGYYCQRLASYLETIKKTSNKIKEIVTISIDDFLALPSDEKLFAEQLTQKVGKLDSFDWIVSVYAETSTGLKNDTVKLTQLKKLTGAYLFLDSTASIGLEDNHAIADVIAYSSNKGLCAITGATFIAYNKYLPMQEEHSFYLNITSHIEKKVTGPYHPMAALDMIRPHHDELRERIRKSKMAFCERFAKNVILPASLQPLVGTRVRGQLRPSAAHDGRPIIFYVPRSIKEGESIVCHFGELHTPLTQVGKVYEMIEIV